MVEDLSKRAFLHKGRPAVIRPPWAQREDQFGESCSKCDLCLPVCPPKILVSDLLGYPKVDFSKGECSFCRKCLQVCPTEALSGGLDTPPWHLKVDIMSSCLLAQGTACRSCGEYCPVGAITFQPGIEGRSKVQINHQTCTGCGACFGVCPTTSIRIAYAEAS